MKMETEKIINNISHIMAVIVNITAWVIVITGVFSLSKDIGKTITQTITTNNLVTVIVWSMAFWLCGFGLSYTKEEK